jgi:hypothetical protein
VRSVGRFESCKDRPEGAHEKRSWYVGPSSYHDLNPETGQRLSRPPGDVTTLVSVAPDNSLYSILQRNAKRRGESKGAGRDRADDEGRWKAAQEKRAGSNRNLPVERVSPPAAAVLPSRPGRGVGTIPYISSVVGSSFSVGGRSHRCAAFEDGGLGAGSSTSGMGIGGVGMSEFFSMFRQPSSWP